METCSFCGTDADESRLVRVKVGVGPDLYFCNGPGSYPQPCAVELAERLVDIRLEAVLVPSK